MADRNGPDGSETEMLEAILATERAESFRRFVGGLLDLRSDETVLSIGCGPGFELATLAADIGGDGRVLGIDANEETLARARARCEDRPQVALARGDAVDLPVPDESVDAAVAKQVYQFVPDVEAALAELRRVLEPGGRAAVVSKDVDARVIRSSDRDRMRRADEIYREAMPHPHLGTRLVDALPEAGLPVETVEPWTHAHTEIDEQVERGIEVQREFLEAADSFDEAEIRAWERDLRDLDEAGTFLACGTQFCHVARKPE